MQAALIWVATISQVRVPDSEFARKVVSECPALRVVSVDIDRVRLLREWAWARTDACYGGSGALDEERYEWWNHASAAELFACCERKEGGVLCRGTGIALQRLYEEFGYRAWTVGHEMIGSFMHTLTLVEIQHKGQQLFSLQDSTWNVDFCNTDGGPIDYFDMLERLREREHDSIVVNEPEWSLCPKFPSVVLRSEFQEGVTLATIVKASSCININRNSVEILPNGTMVVTSPRTWSNWRSKKLFLADGSVKPGSILEGLVNAGYPASPLYWYSIPLWIVGPDSAEILARGRDIAVPD